MKWEHIRIFVEYEHSKVPFGDVTWIVSNGEMVYENDKNPQKIHEYLNQLGKNGWELVSAMRNVYEEVYYLKRPLKE